MLDQNTDRMWYVIGAVLIGAAIILAANTLFPEMFESMTKSFSDLLGRATTGVEGIEFEDVSGGGGATINLFSNLSNMPWI